MQLQASRLDPGGSWAARRAKAKSHPKTTRLRASKGFCLRLRGRQRENHGGRPGTCAADGAQSAHASSVKNSTQGRAARARARSSEKLQARSAKGTRRAKRRHRGEAQSDAQKRYAERGKSGRRESDSAKKRAFARRPWRSSCKS